jgi:pyridoxal phosphate enzyme (YggS family)
MGELMTKEDIIRNLDTVIQDIEQARLNISEHHIVQIVAVSKYSSSDDIKKAYMAGQRAFGENKVQDLKNKSKELEELPIQWHFIGRLQKNKINNLIDLNPYMIHSIDSLDLALELDKKLGQRGKKQKILLQINSSNEVTKAGVKPEDAIRLYKDIIDKCPNLILRGVMSIGTHTQDIDEVKKSFMVTKDIFNKLKDYGAVICSMGMSSDYQLAVSCGSNMVRIGSKIFKS